MDPALRPKHQGSHASRLVDWLTVERALYALALMVGVGLRVVNLGAQPLSPWEAAGSWAAWLAAKGLEVAQSPAPVSALGYNAQWLLFWLGVDGDAGARWPALVAGIGLILAPWWVRTLLGRSTALLLAYLLALDPWLVQFSRFADGAMLALALGAALLIAGARLVHSSKVADLGTARLAAIVAGLLLVSGPMGLNLVPVVGVAGWLWRRELKVAFAGLPRWWVWLLGAAVLGATLGLVRVDALAAVATSVGVWLGQFGALRDGSTTAGLSGSLGIAWPWVRAVVDVPLTVVVGIAGLVMLARRVEQGDADSRMWVWLVAWLAWGVLLCLSPGRGPMALPVLGAPLTLASAIWLTSWLRRAPRDLYWREPVAVLLTLAVLLVSLAFWLAALFNSNVFDPLQAQLVLVALGLGFLIVAAFAVWARRDVAIWLLTLFGLTLLLLFNVRATWHFHHADFWLDGGWQALQTHPDVWHLAEDVAQLSAIRTGDATELPVQVQVVSYRNAQGVLIAAQPDPTVGWYLRHMRNVRWVGAPEPDATTRTGIRPLVVAHPGSGVGDAQSPAPDDFVGTTYRIESHWLPGTWGGLSPAAAMDGDARIVQVWRDSVRPWARWIIYRETNGAATARSIQLWASAFDGQ